ncbi:MAG: methylenetetrahydrofolate reductase C-terminal domain-containing protein [Armatimonadota bacterium]|nr:methylenetetrahydrofolate reductase C-terminal domain-containing protein [Armatimonadota bacterium]
MVPKTPAGKFFYGVAHGVEHASKWPIFRCQMCGQCALRTTGFTCPMRCPKQLRNGPCGGATDGRCETDRNKPCIWYLIYKRSNSPIGKLFGQHVKIEKQFPSIDWRLDGTCAWINLFSGLIDINGHPNREKIDKAFAKK